MLVIIIHVRKIIKLEFNCIVQLLLSEIVVRAHAIGILIND
jgi:hypothetical protein